MPRKKKSEMGEAATKQETVAPTSFRIPPELKRQMRIVGATMGMNDTEFLIHALRTTTKMNWQRVQDAIKDVEPK